MNPTVLAQIYATNRYLSDPMLLQRDRQYYTQLPAAQQALIQQAMYIQQQQMLMQPQRAILPVNYPANYQGPQPPNPYVGRLTSRPAMGAWCRSSIPSSRRHISRTRSISSSYGQYQQPYMPNHGWQYPQPAQGSQQTKRLLNESIDPSQREWAALALGSCDHHSAAIMRASCRPCSNPPARTRPPWFASVVSTPCHEGR